MHKEIHKSIIFTIKHRKWYLQRTKLLSSTTSFFAFLQNPPRSEWLGRTKTITTTGGSTHWIQLMKPKIFSRLPMKKETQNPQLMTLCLINADCSALTMATRKENSWRPCLLPSPTQYRHAPDRTGWQTVPQYSLPFPQLTGVSSILTQNSCTESLP